MWFKNLKIYRLFLAWTLVGDQRRNACATPTKRANNLTEMQSLGWVPPRTNGKACPRRERQILLSLRAEKLLPGTVVNQVAKARPIEEQQG